MLKLLSIHVVYIPGLSLNGNKAMNDNIIVMILRQSLTDCARDTSSERVLGEYYCGYSYLYYSECVLVLLSWYLTTLYIMARCQVPQVTIRKDDSN